MQHLLQQLEQADTLLAAGKFQEAEDLYDKVANDSALEGGELFYRAIDGVDDARKQRYQVVAASAQPSLSLPATGTPVQESMPVRVDSDVEPVVAAPASSGKKGKKARIEAPPAPSEPDESVVMQIRHLSAAADRNTRWKTVVGYDAALSSLAQAVALLDLHHIEGELRRDIVAQQRALQASRHAALLADAERASVDGTEGGYIEALRLLDRAMEAAQIDSTQQAEVTMLRQRVVEQQAQLARPTPSAPAPEASPAAAATDSSDPAVQSEMPSSDPLPGPAEAVSDTPSLSTAVKGRVQDYANKAQSYLQRQTTDNFKEAIRLYDQILGFSELTDTQRAEFERRRTEVKTAYEKFAERFGGLTTARQIAQDEIRLIELRKLLNANISEGPNGEQLDTEFDSLLPTLREKLLRVARELVSLATKQRADGLSFLDPGQLDAAIANYKLAIKSIQGEQIKGLFGEQDVIAIMGIKNLLSNAEVEEVIEDYRQRIETTTALHATLQRVRPLYTKADEHFQSGQYPQVVSLLESAQELAGQELQSAMISGLLSRAYASWEQVVLAQADKLLEAARSFASRNDYGRVEALVGELILLEPQLKSAELQARKSQARLLNETVRQADQKLTELLRDAGRARNSGNLGVAEQLAREALVIRPGHREAQQTLDGILYTIINRTLRDAEDALSSPEQRHLEAARSALEGQRNHVGEITEVAQRLSLSERIEESLEQVKRAIGRLKDRQDAEQRAADLLNRVQQLAANQRDFAAALAALEEARKLNPHHPDLDVRDAEVRTWWANDLRTKTRRFLDATPPNASAAQQCLDTLRQIGMEDATSYDLRRRTARLLNCERGLELIQQGDFSAAIAILSQADLDDAVVKSALRDARRKEALRLQRLGEWSGMLEVLQRADSSDTLFAPLISRARAELALEQAQARRADKDFSAAEARLSDAERELLDDISERVQSFRQQLAAERAVFLEAQRLQHRALDQYQRYAASGNRGDLLAAIRILDDALAIPNLPAGDSQRTDLQKQRETYQSQYQDVIVAERTRLLSDGDQALREERIPDALRAFNAVQDLSPSRQDAEASARLELSRNRLQQMRDKLVVEAKTLLNIEQTQGRQRAVRPGDIQLLMTRLQDAQQLDPETHRALNESLQTLRHAAQACAAADGDLRTARTRWAKARQEGDYEFRDARHDLERALVHFDGRTYVHIELDRNSLESLSRRIDADREAHRTATANATTMVAALGRGELAETIRDSFAELARAEEAIYSATVTLIEHDRVQGVSAPRTLSERYPLQWRVLQMLSSQIKDLTQQAQDAPTIAALRELKARRSILQSLLADLDSDNRFGLQ